MLLRIVHFNPTMNKKMKERNLKAQVWVETAVYTVIGMTIIAILLSVVTPQIEKIKDKGVVEQTMNAMNILDGKIAETEQASGSIRIIDFRIAKGKAEIVPSEKLIRYILEDTKLELTQSDEEIREGNIFIKTEKQGARFNIILELRYDNIDLSYDGESYTKVLQAGTTPYKIKIENLGENGVDDNVHLDFSLL